MVQTFGDIIGLTNVEMDKDIFWREIELNDFNPVYRLDDMNFEEDVQILEQKKSTIVFRCDRRVKHSFQVKFSRYKEL